MVDPRQWGTESIYPRHLKPWRSVVRLKVMAFGYSGGPLNGFDPTNCTVTVAVWTIPRRTLAAWETTASPKLLLFSLIRRRWCFGTGRRLTILRSVVDYLEECLGFHVAISKPLRRFGIGTGPRRRAAALTYTYDEVGPPDATDRVTRAGAARLAWLARVTRECVPPAPWEGRPRGSRATGQGVAAPSPGRPLGTASQVRRRAGSNYGPLSY